MAIQEISLGIVANNGKGDPLREGGDKINQNFTDSSNAASYEVGTETGQIPRNGDLALSGANFGKNLIINGDFSINQEAVTGTVTLAAGEYGHDMFKAGASGCSYTFATSAGVTTITITAGSLLQIIEGQTLKAKPVVLSWGGTAQGRIDLGAYGTSGAVTTVLAGGANVTVEFNTGTLFNPQLELGDIATEFEYVSPADQLARCQRYFERLETLNNQEGFAGLAISTDTAIIPIRYIKKRSIPAISTSDPSTTLGLRYGAGASAQLATIAAATTTSQFVDSVVTTAAILTSGNVVLLRGQGVNGYIDIDARL